MHNAGHQAWKLGVTSESQNNPVSTNGVNSAMTQSVRILRKIKKDLESRVKQQGLRVPPSAHQHRKAN